MDELDIRKQVYFNDVIMRKVVSFVNNVKDRQNLELVSITMNDLSSRVPYISFNNDNSILDIYFTVYFFYILILFFLTRRRVDSFW